MGLSCKTEQKVLILRDYVSFLEALIYFFAMWLLLSVWLMHYLPTTRLWDWLDSQSQSRVVCSRSDFCIRVKSLGACPPLYWQIVEIPGKAFYTSLQHFEQQQQQNRRKSLELNFAQNSLTSKQNSFVIILCHFSLLSQIYKTFIIQCNQNVNGEC